MQRRLEMALKKSGQVKEQLQNRINKLEKGMREMYTIVSIKKDKVEILQDELSYHKYEKSLMEGELENKKEEIKSLTERYKLIQNKEQSNKIDLENKIKEVKETLKAKGKQLDEYLKRNKRSNIFMFYFDKVLVGWNFSSFNIECSFSTKMSSIFILFLLLLIKRKSLLLKLYIKCN